MWVYVERLHEQTENYRVLSGILIYRICRLSVSPLSMIIDNWLTYIWHPHHYFLVRRTAFVQWLRDAKCLLLPLVFRTSLVSMS